MELLNDRSPARIPAAACITAWELTRKNISAASGGGFCTLYGTYSDTIFFVGTLTEKIQRNGQISSLRVSDPTGVLTFSLSPQDTVLLRTADALDVPCFVAITASVRLRAYAGKSYIELSPETLTPADRKTRDAWLCCAADEALSRITSLSPSADRKEFADVLTDALANVRDESPVPEKTQPEVTDEQILAIILELSGNI